MSASVVQDAFKFAEAFAAQCRQAEWVALLSAAAHDGNEHKVVGPLIAPFGAASGFPALHVDWEGGDRKGAQEHSYSLLGTGAHPDAAVLRPFRCAIEIDRETKGGVGQFKEKLMKAAVHVMSGAYDSAVFVYVLRQSTEAAHLVDGSPHTEKLLQTLRDHGLVVAFVAPGAESAS